MAGQARRPGAAQRWLASRRCSSRSSTASGRPSSPSQNIAGSRPSAVSTSSRRRSAGLELLHVHPRTRYCPGPGPGAAVTGRRHQRPAPAVVAAGGPGVLDDLGPVKFRIGRQLPHHAVRDVDPARGEVLRDRAGQPEPLIAACPAWTGISITVRLACSVSRMPVRTIRSVNAAFRAAHRPRNRPEGSPSGPVAAQARVPPQPVGRRRQPLDPLAALVMGIRRRDRAPRRAGGAAACPAAQAAGSAAGSAPRRLLPRTAHAKNWLTCETSWLHVRARHPRARRIPAAPLMEGQMIASLASRHDLPPRDTVQEVQEPASARARLALLFHGASMRFARWKYEFSAASYSNRGDSRNGSPSGRPASSSHGVMPPATPAARQDLLRPGDVAGRVVHRPRSPLSTANHTIGQ